jgi:hypothetical protein
MRNSTGVLLFAFALVAFLVAFVAFLVAFVDFFAFVFISVSLP